MWGVSDDGHHCCVGGGTLRGVVRYRRMIGTISLQGKGRREGGEKREGGREGRGKRERRRGGGGKNM